MVQCISPMGMLSTVTDSACHNTITPGDSVRVRLLVIKNEAAKIGDEASMISGYQPP